MNPEDQFRSLIRQEIEAVHGPITLRDDTDLVAAGLVDSIGLLQLLLVLQEETGVRFPIEQVAADGRVTVRRLLDLAASAKAGI